LKLYQPTIIYREDSTPNKPEYYVLMPKYMLDAMGSAPPIALTYPSKEPGSKLWARFINYPATIQVSPGKLRDLPAANRYRLILFPFKPPKKLNMLFSLNIRMLNIPSALFAVSWIIGKLCRIKMLSSTAIDSFDEHGLLEAVAMFDEDYINPLYGGGAPQTNSIANKINKLICDLSKYEMTNIGTSDFEAVTIAKLFKNSFSVRPMTATNQSIIEEAVTLWNSHKSEQSHGFSEFFKPFPSSDTNHPVFVKVKECLPSVTTSNAKTGDFRVYIDNHTSDSSLDKDNYRIRLTPGLSKYGVPLKDHLPKLNGRHSYATVAFDPNSGTISIYFKPSSEAIRYISIEAFPGAGGLTHVCDYLSPLGLDLRTLCDATQETRKTGKDWVDLAANIASTPLYFLGYNLGAGYISHKLNLRRRTSSSPAVSQKGKRDKTNIRSNAYVKWPYDKGPNDSQIEIRCACVIDDLHSKCPYGKNENMTTVCCQIRTRMQQDKAVMLYYGKKESQDPIQLVCMKKEGLYDVCIYENTNLDVKKILSGIKNMRYDHCSSLNMLIAKALNKSNLIRTRENNDIQLNCQAVSKSLVADIFIETQIEGDNSQDKKPIFEDGSDIRVIFEYQEHDDEPFEYKVIKELGGKGGGKVFHVKGGTPERSEPMDKALKIPHEWMLEREVMNSMFAKIPPGTAPRPVVVKVEADSGFNKFGILMDKLEGCTLEDSFLDPQKQRTFRQMVELLSNVGDIIDKWADVNLVHLDIKPSNIFILKEGDVRLIDLGLICNIGGSTGLEQKKKRERDEWILKAFGSFYHVAPEIFDGAMIGKEAAIYSFGALLCQVFGDKNVIMKNKNRHVKPAIPELGPITYENLVHDINCCVSKKPKDRKNFEKVKEDLKKLNDMIREV